MRMELSFVKVLNTSISAGWLILVVLVLRLLLKKTPKWVHCLLWAMVAVRLICPVSIESMFSLIPSPETVPEIYTVLEGQTRQYDAVLTIVGNSLYPQPVQITTGNSIDRVQVQDVIWTLVWVAGMALMGVYAMISYFRVRHRVKASVEEEKGIWVCDYIDMPFILGLFRPRIYLPSEMAKQDRAYVLAHEKAHLKRKDHWWKPFGFLLLSIYWFNPLSWIAYICLCRDIEMACDEKVIRDLGLEGKKAYSSALLNCSVQRNLVAACPLAFGEVGVKARVKSVLRYQKPAFWVMVISALICIAVAVCFLTDPVAPGKLTLEKVQELAEKGDGLDWKDFEDYPYTDVGSGLYVYRYEIDETFALCVGGPSLDDKPSYVNLIAGEEQIDIRSGDLEDFVAEYTGSPVKTDPVPISELDENDRPVGNSVFTSGANCNMGLDIPKQWEYEIREDADYMSLAFRPEEADEGWIKLQFWHQGFGVCGTGLEQKQIQIGNYIATAGYYDGSKDWSFMVFEGVPGSYVVMRENADSWWAEYEDQVMEILATAKLAQGMKTQGEIQAIAAVVLADVEAREKENAEGKVAVVMGEPHYMAYFHGDVGLWEVGLYFLIDSSPRAEIWLDPQGNVVDYENWHINLYAEDVSKTGLTLVCEQYGLIPGDSLGSPMELMTGAPYWLEVWNGSSWEMLPGIPEEMVWTTEGWIINRNDTTHWNVNWGSLYGALESGTYRIGKNVYKGNRPGQYTHQNYYAVFRVFDVDLGTVTVEGPENLAP